MPEAPGVSRHSLTSALINYHSMTSRLALLVCYPRTRGVPLNYSEWASVFLQARAWQRVGLGQHCQAASGEAVTRYTTRRRDLPNDQRSQRSSISNFYPDSLQHGFTIRRDTQSHYR
jgi:hypothetical protein